VKEEMKRRDFLKTMGIGATALLLPGCLATSKRPNIIFIMSDDHAYQAISSYGSKINKTPSIDRIAEEGVRFENCFCTNSICAPSRAVILTGKFSHINGLTDNAVQFDGNQQTFPKIFQKNGYQTAMIGKWHLKTDPTGFDYWNVLPGQGQYYNPDFIEMGEQKQYMGYATDIITDISLEWLEKRDQNKPFLLMLHNKAPHRNWMPAPKYLTKYDDKDIPEPENFFDDYNTRSDAAREQEMEIGRDTFLEFDLKLPIAGDDQRDSTYWESAYGRMTAEQKQAWDAAYGPKNEAFVENPPEGKALISYKYQRYIKDYLRCIDSVDDNVGRVLDYLDSNYLSDNTLIVYTSDQGFYLGEHGWFDKRFMYEESLRMPLLMRKTNMIRAGSLNADLVQNLDFAPTFLDLAEIEVPIDMQGRSFKKQLMGKKVPDWRDAVYYHYYEYPGWHMVKKHYGVRTDRYKLIHFYDDIDAWELYDLQKDPMEMNNVYNNPEYKTVQDQLLQRLKELRIKYKDPEPASDI
jgi:arylsulfatase A-like enzyme